MRPKPFPEPVYVTRPLLPPREEYFSLIEGIWRRQWLTNKGVLHDELEAALGVYLKAAHISLVGSGTVALMLAAKAFDLAGEVITTPFTSPATINALTFCGLTPVFADIDSESLTLDSNCVESAITSKTCAIVGVHIYGMPCDLGALQGVASRRNLRLIYDGAHAFGTEIAGKSVLDFGDATILSFHATKLFNTAEGGAVVTRDKSIKEKIDLWRTLGIKDEVSVVLPGINARMNELEAALGLCNLKHVEKERSARSTVAAVYADRLERLPGVNCFRIPQNVRNNHSYFVVRIDRERSPVTRDFLYEQLKTFNVFTRRYFYPLCSSFPCYSHLPSSDPRNLKVASRVAEEVLCFPLYGGLKTADVDRICDIVDYIVDNADALRS